MKITTAIALAALQATSTLAWNATCKPGVGPCVGPEVVALESDECQDYHIFIARGSDSGYPGHQGPLVKLICDGLGDSCGYENIVYPANSSFAGDEAWCLSAHKGAINGQSQIMQYQDRCPDSKTILTGFSQGASVVEDIMGGGGGSVYKCVQEANDPLPEQYAAKVVAALTFGAVVRSAHQNWTVTEGKNWHGDNPQNYDGKSPRSEESLQVLQGLYGAKKLREYCNIGDPVCAIGSEPADPANHLTYFDLYNSEAADWVIETVTGKKVAKPSKTASVSSTSSSAIAKSTKTASTSQTARPTSGAAHLPETSAVPQVITDADDDASMGSSISVPFGRQVAYGALALGALLYFA